MPIFRRYVADILPLVPTMLRRRGPRVTLPSGEETSSNILNLALALGYEVMDGAAEALEEYASTSWPLATAAAWVLDQHWLPFHNLQRNGLSDADARAYCYAKRILNKSWGAADQALDIFTLLLPAATLTFTPFYPKAWTINITGVDMATAAPVLAFMEKRPSPIGGGFSVCGDNGAAVIVDPECFNYSSIYGVIGVDYDVTGWFGSVYGAGGGAQAGYAHVGAI